MASSSSDESSKAPDNFQISSASNDDDDLSNNECNDDRTDLILRRKSNNGLQENKQNSPSLQCPLCHKQQKKFNCQNCVKNGNIVNGLWQNNKSLNEMQQKYILLKADIKTFCNNYDRLIHNRKALENINFEIKAKQERVQLINQLILKKRNRLATLTAVKDELNKANKEKRKTLPNYPIKVKKLEDYVLDRIEKISRLRDKQNAILEKLKERTRRSIMQLVEFIFPIQEIVFKEEQQKSAQSKPKSDDLETIAALEEAKNTSYIRGKWVFHGSGISEMQYQIVAPSLPANGDYTAYTDWLNDIKDEVPNSVVNDVAPSKVTAFRIMGALTYTAQLIQLMSFYLNIRLPFKMPYGDFCKKLNGEEFLRKVSRLNSNIMYIAYTQNVQLRDLNENHTLENVLTILDVKKGDLGRHGYTELSNAPLMKSIDSLLIGIETGTESESEDDSSFRLDWEAVPNIPVQLEHHPIHFMAHDIPQSSVSEGLMTSAANRITSMLRWRK